MKVQDKLDVRSRLIKKGVKLTHEQTTVVANWCDEIIFKYQKENQESKIGTRLIYMVIFAIIATHVWFHSTIQFFIVVVIVFIYNFLHFLSNYVFYHNNFRVKKHDKN